MNGPIIELLTPLVGPFKRSGSTWVAQHCPFHRDRTPSFAVNTKNGCWVCHSCGAKGTLPRLLHLLGLPRSKIDRLISPLRDMLVATLRRDRFLKQTRFQRDPYRATPVLPDYLLGAYEFCPTTLVDQGFDPALLQSLEIGFDRSLGRITFPIRDLYGGLAGISGRSVDGSEPRYKVYIGGHSGNYGWMPGDFGPYFDEEFPGYRLDKSHHLWNGHETMPLALLAPADEPIVIVEGFKACLWLIQAGFSLTVALMGASMSVYQADLLRRLANPLVLFLDNNLAGHRGTRKAVDQLASTNLVKSVTYPEGSTEKTQPDDLPPEVIGHMVNTAERIRSRNASKTKKVPPRRRQSGFQGQRTSGKFFGQMGTARR